MEKVQLLSVPRLLSVHITFASGNYDSLAWRFLSRNSRGINIAEWILASINVVIAWTKEFPNTDVLGIPLT